MITRGPYNNDLPIIHFPFIGDLSCVPYSAYIYVYIRIYPNTVIDRYVPMTYNNISSHP